MSFLTMHKPGLGGGFEPGFNPGSNSFPFQMKLNFFSELRLVCESTVLVFGTGVRTAMYHYTILSSRGDCTGKAFCYWYHYY